MGQREVLAVHDFSVLSCSKMSNLTHSLKKSLLLKQLATTIFFFLLSCFCRYQTLAVATDANTKEDIGNKKVSGKKLTVIKN